MKIFRLLPLACALAVASPEAFAVVLPAARAVSWQPGVSVGVPGGIPVTRTNRIDVTQAPYNADNTGATDAAPAIQAAINASAANDIIYLPAGTYRLNSQLTIDFNKDNRTLRGAGADLTILDTRAGSVGIYVGSGSFAAQSTVTGGLAKGSTQLTLADTSAYSVGQMVNVAGTNDPTLPVIHVSGYDNTRTQMVRITAKTATTLTISPGLYTDYSAATTTTVTQMLFQSDGVGIEDLTLDCTNGGTPFGIEFEQCYASWIKNVHVKKAGNYLVFLLNSLQCELRHSFLDQLLTAGTNGAGLLMNGSCGDLIEDNIIYRAFPLMEINFGSSGNVFAYNFLEDSTVFGVVGAAINANHAPHNAFNLYEGNITPNIQVDGFFGGSSEGTIFRNWLHGTGPGGLKREPILFNRFTRNHSIIGNLLGKFGVNYADISGAAVSGPYSFGLPNLGNNVFSGTVQPSLGTVWADFNISGGLTTRTDNTTGVITVAGGTGSITTSSAQVGLTWTGGQRTNVVISSVVGGVVSFTGGAGTNLPAGGTTIRIWAGPGGFQEKDLDVQATTILKANYDVRAGSIPAAEVTALAPDTLPTSFYLSTKPKWFGASMTWPAFDPNSPDASVTTGAVGAGSYPTAYQLIPAGYRFVFGFDPPIAPYVIADPSDQIVVIGNNTTFSVVADGAPTPTYQWETSSDGGGTWTSLTNAGQFSGVTTPTLTITGATSPLDTHKFRAVIHNSTGPDATSAAATLTVIGGAAPSFTTQPATQSVTIGATVTFTAAAVGAPAPTLKWQKNGIDIPGQTSTSLVLNNVTTLDSAIYRAVATNIVSTTNSNDATLTVNVPPAFTSQPQSQGVVPGANFNLTAVVTGSPAPSLQWQKNGTPIGGATSATLNFPSFSSADEASYTLVASNVAGTVTSNAAVLTAGTPPVITQQPIGSQLITVGQIATFRVHFTGVPAPSVQWKKNGVNVPGATSFEYVFAVKSGDDGIYTAVITNSIGTVTSANALLTIGSPPSPTTIQPASQTAMAGSTVTLTFALTGSPTPSIQWRKNGVDIPGATSPTLTLSNISKADAGSYTALVTNGLASILSSTSVLSVQNPGRLTNVSLRAIGGSGSDTIIAGFIIQGASKSILIRGVGPTLKSLGITDPMADPNITVYDGTQAILNNDNWGGTAALTSAFNSVGAYPFTSSTSLDSALISTLAPKTYTSLLNGTGMALLEVYDTDSATLPPGKLINISGRARVGTGNGVLIVGFVVNGDVSKRVLVRAIGPSLNQIGLSTGLLADPKIDLYNSSSTILQSNDNWGGGADLTTAFSQSGAFNLTDPNSKDSALIATLAPGSYTVIVSGVGGATGIGLVEVYELP